MLDVSNLYYWVVVISQQNTECINAPVPSRNDFGNSFLLEDNLELNT